MTTVSLLNRKIIGEAYTQIKPRLYSIFRQACIEEDTCEDLVHEVFLKLLGIPDLSCSKLTGLAVTIAYQKRTDYLRRCSIINNVYKKEIQPRTIAFYYNNAVETNEILTLETRLVNKMSELDMRTYCLSRYEDKNADEIADTLKISKRAVEARLYRTRIYVRNRIKQYI